MAGIMAPTAASFPPSRSFSPLSSACVGTAAHLLKNLNQIEMLQLILLICTAQSPTSPSRPGTNGPWQGEAVQGLHCPSWAAGECQSIFGPLYSRRRRQQIHNATETFSNKSTSPNPLHHHRAGAPPRPAGWESPGWPQHTARCEKGRLLLL